MSPTVDTFRRFRKRTVSHVFWISGSLSLSPALRRWVLASMNWYLLPPRISPSCDTGNVEGGGSARDHLLEAAHRALDLGARGDIVLDLVDERREGDAAGVGGGIFANGADAARCAAT